MSKEDAATHPVAVGIEGKERYVKSLLRLLPVVLLSALLAAVGGVGSARAQGAAGTVVGPGESIQKAVNAAHPGDTIVVRGVHREDVIIRKDGIKLLGEDAVIEAPPKSKADSRCSRFYGQADGICVLGGVDLKAEKLTGPRVSDVVICGFTIRGFEPSIDLIGTRDATVTKNRAVDSGFIGTAFSVGTKILANVVRGPGAPGIGIDKSRNVTVAGNDVQGSSDNALALEKDTSVTIEGNDFTDNASGMFVIDSTGTRILSNDMSRSDQVGIFVYGPKGANDARVIANHVSGAEFGIQVANSHGGSFAANDVHNNCAGLVFVSFLGGPVGGYEVKGNTVKDNTRECPAERGQEAFSGIGIGLLGASDMEVTANRLSGNVPSGPTTVSGGVVVAKDPLYGGKTKPTNNSVVANHFGRNKPDIFYDGSGTGNRFRANDCDTSVPARLCN
jgi:parallel beta-helix repeat protein